MADKIKLLIVTQHFEGGGAEKILSRLIINLHRDYNIVLVTFYHKGRYLEELLSLPGLEYHCINAQGGNTLSFSFRLRKILIDESPHKVLSFLYYPNIVTYLSLIGLRIPFILSERSNHRLYLTASFKHKVWRWLLNKAYRKASSIITVSDESYKAIVNDFNVPEEKIITIHNGLSFSQLDQLKNEPVSDFVFKSDFIYIIAVGSISKAKNYPLLIKSFSILHAKHENTHLIIIGKGEMKNEISELIAILQLNKVVHLTGYCINPYKYMNKASCYVLSSNWEGFPNSLLEAMYITGHVVSTNCPTGPSEIITHNEDGLLCVMDNPEELAIAMERMCFDDNLRKYVFENSRKKIAKFDEKIMIGRYREILNK